MLRANPDTLSPPQQSRAREIADAAFSGFFKAAATGETFAPLDLIRSKFGRTLEQNYPEAGAAFLSFARSYWTFKLLTDYADYRPTAETGHQLVSSIEQNVASVFFPTPGPMKVDPDQREQTQRELLAQYASEIDIDDFIKRNPILIRDRRGSGAGCFGVAVLFTIAAGATLLFSAVLPLAA